MDAYSCPYACVMRFACSSNRLDPKTVFAAALGLQPCVQTPRICQNDGRNEMPAPQASTATRLEPSAVAPEDPLTQKSNCETTWVLSAQTAHYKAESQYAKQRLFAQVCLVGRSDVYTGFSGGPAALFLQSGPHQWPRCCCACGIAVGLFPASFLCRLCCIWRSMYKLERARGGLQVILLTLREFPLWEAL